MASRLLTFFQNMKLKNMFILAITGLVLFSLYGCGESEKGIDIKNRKGMSAEDRKDKRGE